MCDFSTLLGYFISGEALLLTSLVMCGVAIGLNGSFFAAFGAPIPFGASLASAGAAAALFGTALSMVNSPACTSAQCGGQSAALVALLGTVTGALATAFVAGFIALAASPSPGVGAVLMGVYGAAILVASTALTPAAVLVEELQRCLTAATTPATTAAIVVAAIVSITGLILIGVIGATESKKPEPDPFNDGPSGLNPKG